MRISKVRFQKWRGEDLSWLLCEILDRWRPLWLVRRLKQPRLVASMLRCFFEKGDDEMAPLFRDLTVWKHERFRAHLQRYPVLAVSFRGITCVEEGEERTRRALRPHAHIEASLRSSHAYHFRRILSGEWSPNWIEVAEFLFEAYRVKPVVIVESYDALVPANERRDRRTDQLIMTLERAVPNLTSAILIGRTSAANCKLGCVEVEEKFDRPRWTG